MSQAIASQITRHLEKHNWVGAQRSTFFHDFLDCALATMNMLPKHLASAQVNGRYADDDEPTKEIWDRVKRSYGDHADHVFKTFAEAFGMLLSATGEWFDTIGAVYMDIVYKPGSGQYFTPFEVAKMMAEIIIRDHTKKLSDQFAAVLKTTWQFEFGLINQSLFESLTDVTNPNMLGMWSVDPTLAGALSKARIEPETVLDPACGSGVMFLATASVLPAWVTQYGYVRFYGQDIDLTCVKMCHLNMALYGLNGFQVKCYDEIIELDPEFFQREDVSQVLDDKNLTRTEKSAKLQQIKQEALTGTQLKLF